MTDLILEITRAVVIGVTLVFLWRAARKRDICRQEGWGYIIAGFSLLFFGAILAISHNFPTLSRYIVIGDTLYQAFLEQIVGYLIGFLLLAIGFVKWIPSVIVLNKIRRDLQKARDELEVKVAERTDHLKVVNEMLEREIAERVSVEDEMRKFKAICDRAGYGMAIVDLDGNIIYVNHSCAQMHGFTRGELFGKNLSLFHNREQMKRVNKLNDRLRRSGGYSVEEVWHLRKDGSCFPTLMSGVVIRDDEDNPLFMAATMIDISVRKRREEELARLSSALAGLSEMVIITDLDHRIIYANEATEVILGYRPEDMVGIAASQFFTDIPGNPEELAQRIATEAVRGAWQGEIFNRRSDGAIIQVYLTMSVLKEDDGRVMGYVGITRDITDRKQAENALRESMEREKRLAGEKIEIERRRAEEIKKAYDELKNIKGQLIQSEKLSALGRLSAGLAHELNSPLDGIMTLLRLNNKKLAENSPESERNSAMLSAAEHMARIIKDLTSFARESNAVFAEINLNEVIESVLSFSSYQLTRDNISIVKNYSDCLKSIRGEKGQIQQVILNMITNARHAMPEGGTLTITTGNPKDDSYVFIKFIDTGRGIDKDDLDKIFDPFFTTKEPGEGVGLGLSVSYGIIETHQGEITIASEPGKGTTFTVTFPVWMGERDGESKNIID
jgi:PAS domain S-box-containing protein